MLICEPFLLLGSVNFQRPLFSRFNELNEISNEDEGALLAGYSTRSSKKTFLIT